MKHLGNITETIMRNGIVKRFGLAMLAVVLTASIPISAYATGSLGRASEIKSTGNIEVKEGDETKVAIYSSDFTYLANEIDDLERTAKWKNIQALLEIGTDLGIKDENGVAAVSFKEINDAICNSQKISGTYTTEEGPEDDLVGATAENLSLGTAAWVDGEYIVGNGADNKSYYHQGYNQAMDDIVANASVATAGSTYKVPKNGLCTISYVVDFNNEVSSEHNANSANYTLYVNNVAVKSDSRDLGSSSGGTTFTGTWSGNVKSGQSIRINTSSGGWIKLNIVSMTIIIL